jgi:hypothetical protein
MTPESKTLSCPQCRAANPPTVKFCAQCGGVLASTVRTNQPTHAGTDPIARIQQTLANAHATVSGGDGQSTLDFQLAYTDKWLGPFKLPFGGTVTYTPGNSPPHTVSARMLPKGLGMQLGMCVVAAVVLGFVPRSMVSNEMYIGSLAVMIGVTLWTAFSAGPERVRKHIAALLAGGSVSHTAASPSALPLASPSATTAAATSGGVGGVDDVFAQLQRLAQMQATGLLTDDDVAAKKAELLKRI